MYRYKWQQGSVSVLQYLLDGAEMLVIAARLNITFCNTPSRPRPWRYITLLALEVYYFLQPLARQLGHTLGQLLHKAFSRFSNDKFQAKLVVHDSFNAGYTLQLPEGVCDAGEPQCC